MKIEEIKAVPAETVRVRAAQGEPARGGRFGEVRVVLPQDTEAVFVRFGDGVSVAVEPEDDHAGRVLNRHRELRSTRLVHLIPSGDPDAPWALRIFRIPAALRLTAPLSLAVDERIVERVSRRCRKKLNIAETCAWLLDEVALAPFGDDAAMRVIVTGDAQGRFRLLGRTQAVDVQPLEANRLFVMRVAPLPRDRVRPSTLLEAEVAFVDSTVEGAGRSALRAEIEQLVRSAGSYVGLWQRYQGIEQRLLNQRRRELGFVVYTNLCHTARGEWRFEGIEPDRLQEFADVLDAQSVDDLETAPAPPSVLTETEAEADARLNGEDAEDAPDAPRQPRRAIRAAVGHLVGVEPAQGRLTLRPLDEDGGVEPPKKGVIFASLNGDMRRLERRQQAIERLQSGDASLPQLVHILEGQPALARRADHIRPTSEASLRHLANPLTPAQRRALDVALNTPDIALIQGPPGTGKTTVISALLARLAELEADTRQIAGRTLLTSYQHDAVDNAVGVSRVLGLPPVRFGGRQQQRTDLHERPEERIADRWARETTESLRALPCDADSLLGRYRRARGQVAALLAAPPDHAALRRVVNELVAWPAELLTLGGRDALDALRQPLVLTPPGSFARQRQELVARSLRVTQVAFDDDGPDRARAALQALEPLLTNDDRALLQDATHPTFRRLADLARLQARLLDALTVAPLSHEPIAWPPQVIHALHSTLRSLETAVRRSPGEVVDAVDELIDALQQDPLGVQATLRRYAAVYAATCQQAVSFQVVRALHGDASVENVVVDEAARANPLDLFIPMSMGRRRVILVGDHRQLPHMLEPDVASELSGSVDEACRRNLEDSLFERLFHDLREREARDGIKRVVTLDQQFRMHPALGDFVGRAFYAPHGEPYLSPLPAERFSHTLRPYTRLGTPRCAVWKRIPHSQGAELSGRSRSRRAEAEWIAREVKRLLDDGCPHTIGVISFYRAQVSLLMAELGRFGIAERDPDTGAWGISGRYTETERDGRIEERLRVGTVDAFQGMEFDLVFLSVTRSNTQPDSSPNERRRRWGHLMLSNRMCVAMSRQRRLLIAVGDDAMARGPAAVEAVPALSTFLDLCERGEDGMTL